GPREGRTVPCAPRTDARRRRQGTPRPGGRLHDEQSDWSAIRAAAGAALAAAGRRFRGSRAPLSGTARRGTVARTLAAAEDLPRASWTAATGRSEDRATADSRHSVFARHVGKCRAFETLR